MQLTSEQYQDLIRIEEEGWGPNYAKNVDRKHAIGQELGIFIDPVTMDRIKEAGEGGEFTPATPEEVDKDKQLCIDMLQLSLAITRNKRERY